MIPQLSNNYIADYVARWILPPPDSVFQVTITVTIISTRKNAAFASYNRKEHNSFFMLSFELFDTIISQMQLE
jgi:hypothetical protein